MPSPSSTGRAPLVLAAALFALALPRPAPQGEPCLHPRALDAPAGARRAPAGTEPGHTRAVMCGPAPGGPALRGPARLLFQLPVDPNRADLATLERLPGIGPARAAAIAHERSRKPFARPESLLRVHGIGPVTLARLRPWITTAEGELPRSEPAADGAPARSGRARGDAAALHENR